MNFEDKITAVNCPTAAKVEEALERIRRMNEEKSFP